MVKKMKLKKTLAAVIAGVLAACTMPFTNHVLAYEDSGADTEFVDEESAALYGDMITDDEATMDGAIDTTQAIWDVLTLVNQERAAQGLDPLVMDYNLVNTANIRAKEIVTYFDHTRPDGTKCWTAYNSDVTWWGKGENIACGYASASAVMNAWMNSSGHRANILNANFNCIGISCYYVPNDPDHYYYYWVQNFGLTPEVKKLSKGGIFEAKGITVAKNDNTGVNAGVSVNNPDGDVLQYSWYASKDGGVTWTLIQDWKEGSEWVGWTPDENGDYTLVAKVRKKNNTSEVVQSSTSISFHTGIKGICQMPYDGQGGGYLIGIESYNNPNQSYSYEMLILDCTLYAQGLPAWTYTTGKCKVSEGNALWTIWQPEYGYYWTLFRVFDKNGDMVDEICYGFQNIY